MLRDDPAARKFEALFGPEFGHGKPIERARVRKALTALNSPQWNLPPTFHINGGSGKSSTLAFMRAIAEAAGLTVHVFSAPHLLELRERFRIGGKLVETQQLIDAAERLSYLRVDLTHFEAQVVCAFSLFSNHDADLTFIEAGPGGRDDATNVIPSPLATILTAIGLEDPQTAREHVVDRARESAAIMKGGVPLVMARQHEDIKAVVEQMAQRLGAPVVAAGAEWNAHAAVGSMSFHYQTRAYDLPPPALYGAHQIDNAGLAAAALLVWGDRRITPLALSTGMTTVQCRGRLEPLGAGPLQALAGDAEIWVDCGSTAQAGAAMALALRDMDRKRQARTAVIMGLRSRPDWAACVRAVAPEAELFIAAPIGPLGVEAPQIAEAAREASAEVHMADTLRAALTKAHEEGAERILICGSDLLAGEALRGARPIV